jgi:two-component system OmpR family response regulator
MENSDDQTVSTACAAGQGAAAMTVLLLEDDEVIAANVVDALSRDGLGVQWCADAETAEAALEKGDFRVCLVDRALPTVDGLTFIERLRKKCPGMGVIVISALGGLDDRIHGLQAGADDYLPKPFALTELVARVRAQLRRPAPTSETRLRYATLDVDLIERTVRVDGQVVDLLPREYALLTYFMRHAEQVVTRDMLLTEVWRYNFLPQTNLIDVHLGKLRRKIDGDRAQSLIQNVRGAGFVLRAA